MITVVIHTYNEERNIKECISSAKLLTDDVVIVDMESEDNTVKIAKEKGARIYEFPQSAYVEPAREFGMQKAHGDWVFILDADERMTEELTKDLQKVEKQAEFTHFRVPRKNIFGGKKWLKHGGWWPDYQIRLIQKKSFKAWPKEIHSTPVIEGKQGLLSQPLTHLFHGDMNTMVQKTIRFEQIEADLLHAAGRSATTLTFMRKFAGELFRRLIRDRGFLDGTIGIIESIYQAYSKTITYLYLYEKSRSL